MNERMMPEPEKPKFPEIDEAMAREVEEEAGHGGEIPPVKPNMIKTQRIKPPMPRPERIIVKQPEAEQGE